jgi:lipoprotein NlpI
VGCGALPARRELPGAARRHFERALVLAPEHSSRSTTYYHLGTMLRDAGEAAAELRLYELAVAQRVWRDVSQVSRWRR